ncbi:TPA: hypothetical protein ENG04_02095 [Candidatus Poribacteria bacterium]|nr:hypothetical protein [Candidatus Poribacteria bacterium]HEX28854.1 hypothetical protein [Candidatus Poribacteria bacterium]
MKYQAVKSYGVRYSKGDGIVIKGEGTDFNRIVENPDISISSGYNEGNGVHIKDGARFNRIEGNILYNKENGILIEGEGTDSNTVYVGHDNGLAGVAAVDGPKGTVIKLKASREGYANGTAIVLLRNIHSDDSPSAIVQGEFSPPEGKVPSSPCIILEDVSNARISARITGFPTGVLIKGENSRGNDILIEELAGSTTGVHITYKASSNIVRINSGAKDNKLIALIDGEASENTFRLISQGGNENGVIIRNGAKDNLLDRCTFKGETVIIEGDGTSGNRVENSSGMSLLIRDGATNTTIGSLVSGRGNTFSNLPLPFISVQGATTKGVRIIGNRFEGASSEGTRGAIEIENAQDVQIGSDQGAGGNTIIKNPCGILLKKAGKVKILNNLISENRSGIRAEGSSYEVTFQGNKIERNGEFGILIDGNDASKIAIEKNTLSQNGAGIKISGVSDLLISENEIKDSGSDGIRIGYSERGNIERNLITRNKGIGVHISNGSRYISIRSNAIYDNTGKGIAIERGCNGDIPKPFFTSFLASSRRISGGVPSSVPIGSTVEIFGDADDEGQIRLGVASVRAGRNFSTRLSKPLSSGMHLTATVTDPKGNTSEFSTKFKPQTHRPPFIVFTTTRFGNREIHRLFMGELTGTRLTDNPAVDQNPVLSPDHGKIAFVSERSGNPDIWLMGSDGSNLQNLTDNPADDLDPAWSPDGERIAFVSTRDGNPEIFVLDLKSGKLKQLTRTERDVINRHPTWSPDGKRIAFARGSTNGDNFEIFVMNSDGTGSVNITNNTAFDGQPAWSPDGGSIAFVSDRDGNREIYLVNPDGSGIRRLTEEKGEDIDPAWSEDGEILFSSNRDGEFEIYLIDSDGGNLRRVTLSLGINVQPNAGGQ